MFARRTDWNLTRNRLSEALDRHRAACRELLDLTVSNPTECGVEYDAQAILSSFSDPAALAYKPEAKGMAAARRAVSRYYAVRDAPAPEAASTLLASARGSGAQGAAHRVDPNHVLLVTSTSEAYSYVFRLLCEPGDDVLVPAPGYPLFDFLAAIHDARLTPYPLVYDQGWQIDFSSLEKAVGPRSRAIVVVNPNNPTGSFVSATEAEELNRLCAARRLALVADEVFLDYAHDGRARPSFSSNLGALTFTLSGLSKIAGLPQMKIAWIVAGGPEGPLRAALERLEVIADTYLSLSTPQQLALPTLLEQRSSMQRQLGERIRGNLEELDRQLTRQKLCRRLQTQGGWYVIVRVPAVGSDEELAIDLLEKYCTLLHPGHFYDFPQDGFLVASLITPAEVFCEGIRRTLEGLSIQHSAKE